MKVDLNIKYDFVGDEVLDSIKYSLYTIYNLFS